MKLKAKKITTPSIEYLEIDLTEAYIYQLDENSKNIDEVLAEC
ncbi:MAG: hypothetical protein R6V14_04035 [Halanaerobiales bacterium]